MDNDGQTTVVDPQSIAEGKVESKLDRLMGLTDDESADTGDEASEVEGGEGESAPPALEEVELDGETLQVSPKIKAALLRQQDYTRKTMEVANERKVLQAQRQMLEMESRFAQDAQEEFKTLNESESALARFSNIDWTQLDTDQMVRTKHAYDQLKDQRDQAKEKLAQKRYQFQQMQMQVASQMLERGAEYLRQAIPEWSPKKAEELRSYGVNEGFSAEEMGSVNDPRFVKLLWKANQFDVLRAAKGQALKAANGAPPVVRPGNSIPELSAKMQNLRMRKDIRSAKTQAEKQEIAGKKLDRFFG